MDEQIKVHVAFKIRKFVRLKNSIDRQNETTCVFGKTVRIILCLK